MNKDESRSELKWVLAWAAAIVLLASIPYLWGVWIAPPGDSFLGLTHNIDDGAVYLSWMRQVADGDLTYINLFTNEPVKAHQFNVLFVLTGAVAGITHIPLIWVYHLFRVLLGVGVIVAVWQFSKLFLESANERRLLIPLVSLTAGIGWLMPGLQAPTGPVDNWQPEAITFLSIYLNPLFLAALILMLGSFYFLVLSQRTGSVRHAICAGLSMLLLANIHTYDVLTVACVWTCYLIVLGIAERKFPARLVGLSALAGVIAVPSIAYQLYLYRIDEVFRARANSPIPSPPIYSFLAGYGLVLAGAAVGATLLLARRRTSRDSPLSTLHSPLLLVWSILGFALPYIPVAQQRKLVMGLHIPLCMLCAYALSNLMTRLPRSVGHGLLLAFILFSTGSNVGFLSQDINLLSIGRTVTHYAPYLSDAEMAAMRYLRADGDWHGTVLAPPTFALFTPVLAGHRVYYGHWSETPDYAGKLREWGDFVDPSLPVDLRASILAGTGASYFVSTLPGTIPPTGALSRRMEPAFTDGPVTVYRIRPQASGSRGGSP